MQVHSSSPSSSSDAPRTVPVQAAIDVLRAAWPNAPYRASAHQQNAHTHTLRCTHTHTHTHRHTQQQQRRQQPRPADPPVRPASLPRKHRHSRARLPHDFPYWAAAAERAKPPRWKIFLCRPPEPEGREVSLQKGPASCTRSRERTPRWV